MRPFRRRVAEAAAVSASQAPDGAGERRGTEHASWGFEPGDELAPGRSVVDALGGGTAYEVFLVWDERLAALVVAKVLRPGRAEEERELRSLGEEAEALERLAHPVLVRGFDAVLDGPHPHVLIEHLEGPSLRQLIRRGGPLPQEQLLPLAVHLASALHLVAGEGWVHLDVKPDNVIMGLPPRLIDLSVARTAERARELTVPIGTDAYMAPEQCAPGGERGPVGPPADVWGLAATVFHALAGDRPFPRPRGAGESRDPHERFPQLHADPPAPPPGTAPELADVLGRALQRDQDARPTPYALIGALEPAVERLPRKLLLGRRGARAV